jgi:hypothetical protein
MIVKIVLLFILSCFSSRAVNLDDGFEDIIGQEVMIENVLETSTIYPTIEGKTIKNLATIDSDYEIKNNNGWFQNFTITETANLKLNTPYTMIVYKENLENHSPDYNVMEIGVANSLKATSAHPTMTIEADSTYYSVGFRADNTKQSEVFKAKMEFQDFKDYKYLSIRPMRRRDSDLVSTEYSNTNIKIVFLEGDWIDYDIDYFSGIKGVEEVVLNSNTVNLFNINGNINEKYDVMAAQAYNEVIEGNGIQLNNFSSTAHGRGQKFKLKPNTDYILSFKSESGVAISICTPTKANYYLTWLSGNSSYKFNSKDEEEFIVSFITSGRSDTAQPSKIYDIMIREAIYPDNYSVYGNSSSNAKIRNAVHGIDGVYDYILKKDNTWKIERNLKEIILDENTINDYTLSIDSNNILSLSKSGLNIKPNAKSISSLMYYDTDNVFDTSVLDSIYSLGYSDNSNLIKIRISGLSSVDDYKQYFKDNPVNIVYELNGVEYENLGYNLDLKVFQGTNIINLTTNIPTVSITSRVDRTLNIAYECVALALEYPTMENIANARYWINQLEDSSLKDSLSDAITEITDIDDFKIDKKTVTMNVDMYLKFKNSLGLSLETTSISFEDFSSTDAMVKNEAIKLNVSSTLDYNVNTYLATDIVSSKNNKISKASLYIKNSSDTDSLYKSYASDKLTLLSSEAGTNNTHLFDLKLDTDVTYKADVYKTVIKIEVQQF